ncbi:MAG: zinc-ribbon domain-containing protein [Myxococcaceae bacterium]
MQIGCPQCQTLYALDDRLVPPGGAPVQCTRCGHVFIAYRPGDAPQAEAQSKNLPASPAGAPRTQVFGGAAVQPSHRPPDVAPTPAFGTDKAPPPAPAVGNRTQVFGGVGADAAAAPPPSALNQTQLFGGAAAPTAPVPTAPGASRTQVFGGAAAPPVTPPAPAGVGRTQVFGGAAAPPVTSPAPAGVGRTQVFGGAAATPVTPPASAGASRTQVFGGAAAPPVASPASAGAGRTQVFGGTAAPPPPAPAPPEGGRTQVFGAAAPAPAPPGAGRNQTFGAGTSPPAAAPAPPGAAPTQVFGGSAAATTPAPLPLERTPVSGASAVAGPGATAKPQAPIAPATLAAPAGGARSSPQVPAATPPQLGVPGRSEVRDATAATAVASLAAPAGAHAGTVLFGAPPAPKRARSGGVMLPPEEPDSLVPPLPGLRLPGLESRVDAAEMALRRGYERRNRNALGIVLSLVVLALGAALVRSFLPSWQSAPVAAVVEEEAVFAQLRRDDATSRSQAEGRLRALVSSQPRYVEAHAALALALLLDLDDRRAAIQRYTREADALTTQKARLEAERPGLDWRVQANRLLDKISALKVKSDPLIEDAKKVQAQANLAYAALMKLDATKPAELLARTRTEALFDAIDGRDQAIVLAERYRQMGGLDGWADIANAEYALNTRVPPETASEALDAMRALQQRDNTFIRAYVLGGRLALQTKRLDLAASQFDATLALNPNHALAQTLADDARAAEPREPH